MHFGTGKSRDVLCRACRIAPRDTLVTTSATGATCTTRVPGASPYSVDWGGHVHLTFSRRYSWDWCKSRAQKTKLVHVSTTASSSSAMLEQARRDTHDTSRHDTHDTSCVSCRDLTKLVEFGLNWATHSWKQFALQVFKSWWIPSWKPWFRCCTSLYSSCSSL